MLFSQRVKNCRKEPYLFLTNRPREFISLIIILMILIISPVSAEIIDEKTEKSCVDGSCELIYYSSDVFKEYNDQFWTFEDFSSGYVTEDYDIVYNYEDGTQITLTPFGIYKGNKYYIKDLDPSIQAQIDFNTILEDFRDDSKFTINMKKVKFLTAIGFQVTSNKPIAEFVQEYPESGIFDEFNPPEIYSVTELQIGGIGFSYLDLLENGFDVSYSNYEFLIDISDRPDNSIIDLDPLSTYYSKASDGFWTLNPACSASSTGTTYLIGSSLTVGDKEFIGAENYNTSLIPDDATINEIRIQHYVNTKFATRGFTPSSWDVLHKYDGKEFATPLSCTDYIITEPFVQIDHGSTGWKNYTIDTTKINVSGFTGYSYTDTWGGELTGIQEAYIAIRTSEYTGTTYDPRITINYTEYVAPVDDEEPKEPVWDAILIFSLFGTALLWIFVAARFDHKEHFVFRMFLIMMSLFMIIIAANVAIILCEYYSNKVSNIETIVGDHTDGDIFSLAEIDGNSYNVTEVVGTPGFAIALNFTNVIEFSEFSTYAYYDGNAGHIVEILLWNNTGSQWDYYGEIEDAMDFDEHNFPVPSSAEYINNGLVMMEINHTSPGNINHDLYIDHLNLRGATTCLMDTFFSILIKALWVFLAFIFLMTLVYALKQLNGH